MKYPYSSYPTEQSCKAEKRQTWLKYKPKRYDSFFVYLHREGKGSLFLRKNVTLDPRQKDRLQETGHVFVITEHPLLIFSSTFKWNVTAVIHPVTQSPRLKGWKRDLFKRLEKIIQNNTRGFFSQLRCSCLRPSADETKLPDAREKRPLVPRVPGSRTNN